MIVSKSHSQATLPEDRSGRLTSCKIGDSVLYHSLLGSANSQRLLVSLVRDGIPRPRGISGDESGRFPTGEAGSDYVGHSPSGPGQALRLSRCGVGKSR
jgi:hypothetical protein